MERLKALGRGTQIMFIASVLLLIISFFNWQEVEFDLGPLGEGSAGVSAWDNFLGIIMGILTIVLIARIAARMAAVDVPIPVSFAMTSVVLGVLIAICAVLKNLTDDYSTFWSYLGVALAILVAVGAWLEVQDAGGVESLKSRGEQPRLVGSSSTRRSRSIGSRTHSGHRGASGCEHEAARVQRARLQQRRKPRCRFGHGASAVRTQRATSRRPSGRPSPLTPAAMPRRAHARRGSCMASRNACKTSHSCETRVLCDDTHRACGRPNSTIAAERDPDGEVQGPLARHADSSSSPARSLVLQPLLHLAERRSRLRPAGIATLSLDGWDAWGLAARASRRRRHHARRTAEPDRGRDVR